MSVDYNALQELLSALSEANSAASQSAEASLRDATAAAGAWSEFEAGCESLAAKIAECALELELVTAAQNVDLDRLKTARVKIKVR